MTLSRSQHFLFLSWSLITLVVSVASQTPNILLILVDDLGNADASFNFRVTHGLRSGDGKKSVSPPILTPNLDKLAENGIIFSNHYTHHLCALTRSALLTGRLAHRLGNPFPSITDLDMGGDLEPGYVTFAHELQRRDYSTHFIGKYGIDNHRRKWNFESNRWEPPLTANNVSAYGMGPIARGFDTFFGMYGSAHHHYYKTTHGRIDWHKFNKTHFLDAPDGLDPEVTTMSSDIFVRETLEVIRHSEENPWFIHLSFSAPHDPLMVDPVYVSDAYPHCAQKPNHRRKVFCGMVANVDVGVGQIVNMLEEKNLLSNTIVIFSSDNGGFPYVGGYNYPYRGAKAGAFQGAVLTPSFIYAPALFPHTSKQVFDGMMHVVDWGPTLLSLVDQVSARGDSDASHVHSLQHQMGDVDGRDYSFVLKNFKSRDEQVQKKVSDLLRTELILETNGWANMTSAIWNDYKLVLGYTGLQSVLHEPDDWWGVSSEDRPGTMYLLVPDVVNTIIAGLLGPDYFMYEWASAAVTSRIRDDYVLGGHMHVSSVCRHPDGLPKNGYNDFRPLWVPSVNWDNELERGKIRLYDIKKDPTESNNIAMENKEIVEKIVEMVVREVEKEREKGVLDRSCGLNMNMVKMSIHIASVVATFLVVSILACVCMLMQCRSQEKAKQKVA